MPATSPAPTPSGLGHGVIGEAAASPLVRALHRRRRLRQGLVQLFYLVLSVGLALTLPRVDLGPTLDGERVASMLLVVAGAMFTFIAVVYSLLFLVVQWSMTTFTPRLHLFRDDPVVWHAFGLLVGVFVYCLTGAIVAAEIDEVPALVAAGAIVGSVASIIVFRLLQAKAFRSIQLASTLGDIAERGRRILDALYLWPAPEDDLATVDEPVPESFGDHLVRWTERPAVLCQVDLAGLLDLAVAADTVVAVGAPVGALVMEDGVLVRLGPTAVGVEERLVRRCLELGLERTFDQDPLLAFRLLVDIALKALSAAVADPVTAIQAIDAIDGLLHRVSRRHLDVGRIHDADGTLRVVLPLPTWDEYLELANDEIALAAAGTPIVLRRLERLLTNIRLDAPVTRRQSLEDRLRWLRRQLDGSAPVLAAP